jgi:hypothetical protein
MVTKLGCHMFPNREHRLKVLLFGSSPDIHVGAQHGADHLLAKAKMALHQHREEHGC